jgi:hypothetical protein
VEIPLQSSVFKYIVANGVIDDSTITIKKALNLSAGLKFFKESNNDILSL